MNWITLTLVNLKQILFEGLSTEVEDIRLCCGKVRVTGKGYMNLQQKLEQALFASLVKRMPMVHFQGPEDHTYYRKGYYHSPDSSQFSSPVQLLFNTYCNSALLRDKP
ncbi:unnamed protein product [Bubo scandiacus]